MKNLMTLVLVLLAAGCMQAPQTDLEGLKAMRDVWQSAFDARDAAALAAIYTEDGALMPPNSDTLIGRAAIEAFWADMQASGISGEIKDTEVYAHGDDGYKVGTYTISDADGATVDEGKYVEIWRHIDGTWQMHRDIFNSNLPLSAPEPEAEKSVMGSDTFIRHMHLHARHLDGLNTALAAGDLEAAQAPAHWLLRHEGVTGHPDDWQPHIERMRDAARAVTEAGDIETARVAAQGIVEGCRGCHVAAGVDIDLSNLKLD